MELVDPAGRLKLLTVEGLTVVDDPDDDYEAVDVAEYLGGEDFDEAVQVLASQLKHSTRHPDLAWTAARLCAVRKRRKALPGRGSAATASRSVLRDLAGVYQRLLTQHGRDAVIGKLRVQLVSNQTADAALEAAVASASAIVRTQPGQLGAAALIKLLRPSEAAVVSTLWRNLTGQIHSRDFCDFLTVLDLSECGRAGRFKLEREVRAQLSRMAPDRTDDAARALFDLVRREALPDQSRVGLRRADVLAALGVGDDRTLFPAPSRLVHIRDPLPAPTAARLAQAIIDAPGGTVIAHGAAGAGKTTTLTQLAGHLPDGSLVLIYDCFGGGEYLSTGEERHTPRRFLTQVINELALLCGTPLLLQRYEADEDLWRRLSETLHEASRALPAGARLVLAVDAADNAAFAAERMNQRGFLPALRGLPLPPNAVVVLTARTHRLGQLGPQSASDIVLDSFDPQTSAEHFLRYFPRATAVETADFHARTGGNPRAQFYVLERARREGWDIASTLTACRGTPDELFRDLVDSALHISGSDIGGVRWLAMLTALSRPVRLDSLTAALQVDGKQAYAFAAGLFPGVRIEAETIAFRDEDFEHYVRAQLTDEDLTSAHSRLADLFLATRHSDADAAEHVADHLASCERMREVVQIVLDDPWPAAIPDGFQRLTTQGRRLDLAVHAAQSVGDASQALRVVMRAVAVASSRHTLATLVRDNVQLVARHADPIAVARQHLHQSADEWLGPAHMRAAGILSRDANTHDAAREHLDAVMAWLRRWQSEPKDQTYGWRIEAQDVALAAEALLRVDGAQAACAWLRRWLSIEFRFDVVTLLAARVAPESGPQQLRQELDALGIPAVWHAPFLAYAGVSDQPPAADWVDLVVEALLRRNPGKPAGWKDRFSVLAVRYGDRELAVRLLRHWHWPTVENSWSYRTATSEGVSVLRQRALEAALEGTEATAGDMLPPALREEKNKNTGTSQQGRSYQEDRWLQMVRPLLRLCTLRAQLVTGSASQTDLLGAIEEELRARTQSAGHRWFRGDGTYRGWATMAAELILDAGGDVRRLDGLADRAPTLMGDQAPWLWLDLASILTARRAHLDRAAALCVRAADHAERDQYSAADRLELLAECTVRADEASEPVGETLFARTMQAAESIDDAGAELLRVHARLAQRAAGDVELSEAPEIAGKLANAAQQAARYVSERNLVPYEKVLGGAARLHPPTAFATASRWDDEDRFELADGLAPVLTSAVDAGFLPASDALCLQHLIENHSARIDSTLRLLERLPPGAASLVQSRQVLRATARWVRGNVRASDQSDLAERLLGWAAGHGIADQELHSLLDAVVALGDPADPDAANSRTSFAPRQEDPRVTALLANPATRPVASLADDVKVISAGFASGAEVEGFVLGVVLDAAPGERLTALTAVASLADERRSLLSTVLDVLSECLTRWRGWPGLDSWAKAALSELVARFLPQLAWQGETERTVAVLRTFGLTDHELRGMLLAALRDHRADLTAYQLHYLAAVFAELVEPDSALHALRALLGEIPVDPHDLPPVSAPKTIAGLLWSAFGHYRKAVRWRAAHAARELLVLDRPEHADALIEHLQATTAGPFRSPELHFYWLSARVWLLATLQRVADERPELLKRHRGVFVGIATDTSLPHAQIRELARWTAQALSGWQTTDDDVLALANQPVACRATWSYGDVRDTRSARTTRYDFDSVDTLPYWYTPLARVFGIPLDDVAQRAERWIVDKWGMGKDDWMADARELRDEKTAERMSHRHGSIPTLESLRLYLEFHAMMLAAGELVDAGTPVLVRPDDEPPDPWCDWLHPRLPGSEHAWLADLRSPIPAEPMLFGHVPSLDRWQDTKTPDFEQVLGLTAGTLPDPALVAGYTDIYRPKGHGTIRVRSALVNPAYAPALQRALQASSNPVDWRLPDEDDHEFEVHQGLYELRGWLRDEPNWTRRDDSMDALDPNAEGLSWTCVLPGRDFRQRTGCAVDTTTTRLLYRHGQPAAWSEQWSDEEHGAEHRPDYTRSSGHRTYIRASTLRNYLKHTGMQLIMEVQIGRHGDGTDGTGAYRTPVSRLYRLDEHGRVHAL